MSKRFLMIGAHPDDADIRFGGTAIMLARAGHTVKFVSMCNGNCGHYEMSGRELADRRFAETQASVKISGISEYQVLSDINDCELTDDLEKRKRVIRIIREFAPDVVLTHRLCDYHADHRATSQLVHDAAYLTQVPKYCPETPIPAQNPVFACVWDSFIDPRPFRVDAIVPIDSVIEDKCRMLDCHVSQFYEWLAWEKNVKLDFASMSWDERKVYLLQNWGARYEGVANDNRELLETLYGDAGKTTKYAEAFELSPYGRKVSIDEFRQLFMF